MTEIPISFFANCSSLKYVTIPDEVQVIPDSAFKGCGSFTVRVWEGSFAEYWADSNGRIKEIVGVADTIYEPPETEPADDDDNFGGWDGWDGWGGWGGRR
jgi:hypothetical protein